MHMLTNASAAQELRCPLLFIVFFVHQVHVRYVKTLVEVNGLGHVHGDRPDAVHYKAISVAVLADNQLTPARAAKARMGGGARAAQLTDINRRALAARRTEEDQ